MKENKNTTCEPCAQDFKKKVNELVNEGHAPSTMERMKRSREVHAAFGQVPKEDHAPADAMKPKAEHAHAGMMKPKK